MSFVRKSLLTISGQFFTPGYGLPTSYDIEHNIVPLPQPEPSSVTCVVRYYAPINPPLNWESPLLPGAGPFPCPPPPAQLSATIVLTLQADGLTWLGTWDSSVAEGRIDWAVWSVGVVVAAAQGTFKVQANSANVSVP